MRIKILLRRLTLVLLVSVACAGFVTAQVTTVGLGTYSRSKPGGATGPSTDAGQPTVPLVVPGWTGPVPTNDWWSSLVFNRANDPLSPWSRPMYAHPLVFQARPEGLEVRYPTDVTTTETFYYHGTAWDVRVAVDGLSSPDARLARAGDFTATAAWTDGTRRLEATMGHGLPFVFFSVEGAPVSLTFGSTPNVRERRDGSVFLTVNGRHYGIFGPVGTTWTGTSTLTSDLAGRGFLSIAVLPDSRAETFEAYRRRAYAFVTGSRVEWQVDPATQRVTTTFSVTTEQRETNPDLLGSTLLALYRHQWHNSSTPRTAWTYVSPRGTMKVVDGNTFTTGLDFGGVLPGLPTPCATTPDAGLYALVDAVFQESNLFPGNQDAYWNGKAMARLAALIPIAEQVGHTAAATRFTDALKARLQQWFSVTDGSPRFWYETTWGTLLAFPESFGSASELNDHHFHYGYFVQAAAAVARRDPDWARPERWGGMVDVVIRDVASDDRQDPLFPFLRSFDPYAGHSWASGTANNADGNNQESSSEAMNLATGIILWGLETGNQRLRDLGIYLYATERSAIEEYWFDVDNVVFPPAYQPRTAALVWGNKGAYQTFFGGEVEYIHGINWLPITGGSLYLGRHPVYVRANYDNLVARNGGEPDRWADIAWQYLALSNAPSALNRLPANGVTSPETGESRAHTRHWITSLVGLGRVDTTVTADHASSAVFNKDGRKTYAVYNPGTEPLTVRFTDGFATTVPANALVGVCASGTATEERPGADPGLAINGSWPNPFEGETSLSLSVGHAQHVVVSVFDVLGRRVAVLHDGLLEAGREQVVPFDASALPAGVYLVEAAGTDSRSTRIVTKSAPR